MSKENYNDLRLTLAPLFSINVFLTHGLFTFNAF